MSVRDLSTEDRRQSKAVIQEWIWTHFLNPQKPLRKHNLTENMTYRCMLDDITPESVVAECLHLKS